MDPYRKALALFDQRDRVHYQQLEAWAISVAHHNNRLHTTGQRLADMLATLRTQSPTGSQKHHAANRDAIDQLLNAWNHATNHAS
jgi:hypothetical protein